MYNIVLGKNIQNPANPGLFTKPKHKLIYIYWLLNVKITVHIGNAL